MVRRGARLYHKLDFFHSAGEGSAGGGCELEVTVAVDAGYGGAKGLAFVDVVGFDSEAVEAAQIAAFEVSVVFFQMVVLCLNVAEQGVQQVVEIVFGACQQAKRCGVWHPVGEGGLVDVEADAADGLAEMASAYLAGY